MGRGKRLTAEDIGSIKCLREEGYSNREIAIRFHRSAKFVNNFVQDIENYGKNYIEVVFKLLQQRGKDELF
jgi:transposase